MKLKKLIIPALCIIISFASIAAGDEASEKSPSAFLPEQVYTFEPVAEGTVIVHDFILQNRGNDTLLIENLKSG